MSINYYTNKKEFLQFLKLHSHMAEKYSLLSLGSGFMDLSPGFHPAGHTSSGFSWTYCNAWERYQQLGKYTKTKKFPLTNCLFPSKISQLEFKTRTLHPFRISWSCFTWRVLIVSSTLRPMARLLIVECWMTPSLSMMKSPLNATP